tara:strand:- start:202 stop:6702 length:6501 start_codon:yes stop_codon:yes gene_type:complete
MYECTKILNYQMFCKELYNIIDKHNPTNIKIYEETILKKDGHTKSIIYNDKNEKILSHYFQDKVVPTNHSDLDNRIISSPKYIKENTIIGNKFFQDKVVPRNHRINKKLQNNTRKITICLCARDNEKYIRYIDNVFNKILDSAKKTLEFEFFFYENNSTDNTKNEIRKFFNNKKGKYLCENIKNNPKRGGVSMERGIHMATLRNKLKEFHGKLDSEYVILLDTDVIFTIKTIYQLINTITQEIVMVSPFCICYNFYNENNKLKHYYDSLAVISKDDINYNTCLFKSCIRCKNVRASCGLNLKKKYLFDEDKLIYVNSAFGSMALIKTDIYNKVSWGNSICEHHSFCKKVLNYGSIVINPVIKTLVTNEKYMDYKYIERELKDNIEMTLNINKTIYMTYYKKIPDFVFKRWTKLNKDFQIDFSLDKECIEFLKNNFNQDIDNLFKTIKVGMFKADLWRLCKLYVNSGVYADIDLVPYLNMDDLEKDVTFYTCLSAHGESCFQAFIANFSKPKNPLILAMLISFIINKPYNNPNGPTYDMYKVIKYNLDIDKIKPDTKYNINTIKIPIKVGWSPKNIKIIDLMYFPEDINFRICEKNNTFKDTFDFKIINNKLFVERTDQYTGWGQDLEIDICIDSNEVIYLFPEFFGENNNWKTSYINYNNNKILDSRDLNYEKGVGYNNKINDIKDEADVLRGARQRRAARVKKEADDAKAAADIIQYNLDRKTKWHFCAAKRPYSKRTKLGYSIKNEEIIKINKNISPSSRPTLTSFIISANELREEEMKERLISNYYFIDVEKFPKNISAMEKHKIIGNSHINCWRKALELDLDGALFFEDDVTFINNWRNILRKFIDEKNPDIVRLDSIPYRMFTEDHNDSIYFYKATTFFCLGGYYLSKRVLKHCVDFFDNNPLKAENCELAFAKAFQKFYDTLYTSTPRLCIQDWFKNSHTTRVASDDHIKNLCEGQLFYLKKYGHHYPEWIAYSKDIKPMIPIVNNNDISKVVSKNHPPTQVSFDYLNDIQIISLGSSCDVSLNLKRLGINNIHYFFDFIWNEYDGLRTVTKIIKNNFIHFNDLINYTKITTHPILNWTKCDINKYYPNLVFMHHDTEKKDVIESFIRKINRTEDILISKKKKVFIYYRHYGFDYHEWRAPILNIFLDLEEFIKETLEFCSMYKDLYNENFHLISLITYEPNFDTKNINKHLLILKKYENDYLTFDFVYRRHDSDKMLNNFSINSWNNIFHKYKPIFENTLNNKNKILDSRDLNYEKGVGYNNKINDIKPMVSVVNQNIVNKPQIKNIPDTKINLKIHKWRDGLGHHILQVKNIIQIALYCNYNVILPEHPYFTTTYIRVNKEIGKDSPIKDDIRDFCGQPRELSNIGSQVFNENIDKTLLLLKNIFKINDILVLKDNNLVIDMISNGLFSNKNNDSGCIMPPLSYYKDIIDERSFDQIIIISDDDKNPVIKELLKLYPNIQYTKENLVTNVQYILGCKNIIEGYGTLTQEVLQMSKSIKNIYYPSYQYTSLFLKKRESVTYHPTDLDDYRKSVLPWKNTKEQLNKMMTYNIYDKDFTLFGYEKSSKKVDGIVNNTQEEIFMNKNKLFWQYPVITEETFFKQNKLDPEFLGLPWATFIDNQIKKTGSKFNISTCNEMYTFLNKNLNLKNKKYTCCQHIYFKSLIPLFKKLGVSVIYTPHKIIGDDNIDGIQIRPCPLYAVNVEDKKRNLFLKNLDLINKQRDILFSFRGAYGSNYITDIRKQIFNLPKNENSVIINTKGWHFQNIVYSQRQNYLKKFNKVIKEDNEMNKYNDLLINSKFTLCPSGAGPNSIRFWEALGCGSIPVLLADTLDLPEHELWDKSILRVKECDIFKINSILSKIPETEIKERRENCIKIYKSFKDHFKKLNMVLFTNCHGAKYIKMFKRDSNIDNMFNINYIISHLNLDNFEHLKCYFENADILIINKIKSYNDFTIKNLKKILKKDVLLIIIPFVRFEGYWFPEKYKRLKNIGANAVSFVPDINVNQIDNYLNLKYDSNKFLIYYYNCLNKLKNIEIETDIEFYDFFINNHTKYPMFRDNYHPTLNLLEYLGGQIMIKINNKFNINYKKSFKMVEETHEYGHYKPIINFVKDSLKIKYNLDKIFICSRKEYLSKIINYDTKGPVVKDLTDLKIKLWNYLTKQS